jgi:hypothetical protein
MKLPQSLLNELDKLGIDEADITELILQYFKLDKDIKVKIYKELSNTLLSQVCNLIKNVELDNAKLKLCKSIELYIRSISLERGIEEAEKLEKYGKWTPSNIEVIAKSIGDEHFKLLNEAYSLYEKGVTKEELINYVNRVRNIMR